MHRKTKETDIQVEVDLSREGPSAIATGLGFFDHMLEQIAKHGGFALDLKCSGDLQIDEHHTVEDCALALGAALREALGDKRGIARYGFLLAMDEAEAQVALDLSGRPYFVWEGRFDRERVGELPTELVPHFFRSLAQSLGAALHITRARRELAPHDRILLQGRGPQPAPGHSARRQRAAEHQGRAVSRREVVIVASGANIASLQFALQRLGAAAAVSADAAAIRAASHVILPGVGAAARGHVAAAAMRPGRASFPACSSRCSAFASGCSCCTKPRRKAMSRCLGIIPGRRGALRALRPGARCRTWAGTRSRSAVPAPCSTGLADGDYAYFVHSYALDVGAATVASTHYGAPFSACVQWRNFYGAQFHPERSAAVGARCCRISWRSIDDARRRH